MELALLMIVIALVIYFLFGRKSGHSSTAKKDSTSKKQNSTKEERILNENSDWLEQRWEEAEKEKIDGDLKSVPEWFFDKATDRQLQKLEDIGVNIQGDRVKKGEASDLIGLFEPTDDTDIEVLKFFKVSMKGMSQSKAKYEIRNIFSDAENTEKWKNRSANAMQKEFYRFHNIKVPRSLSHEAATKFINENSANGAEKTTDWDNYESIYKEIIDPDFREENDLKKVSLPTYRSAIEQLKNEGKSFEELTDDIDLVVDKILELNPGAEK